MSPDLRGCAFEALAFMTEAGHQRPRAPLPLCGYKGAPRALYDACARAPPGQMKPQSKTFYKNTSGRRWSRQIQTFLWLLSALPLTGKQAGRPLEGELERTAPLRPCAGWSGGGTRVSHTNAPFRVRPALCEDLAPAQLGPGGAATAFWRESTRAPPGKGAGTAQTSAEM